MFGRLIRICCRLRLRRLFFPHGIFMIPVAVVDDHDRLRPEFGNGACLLEAAATEFTASNREFEYLGGAACRNNCHVQNLSAPRTSWVDFLNITCLRRKCAYVIKKKSVRLKNRLFFRQPLLISVFETKFGRLHEKAKCRNFCVKNAHESVFPVEIAFEISGNQSISRKKLNSASDFAISCT